MAQTFKEYAQAHYQELLDMTLELVQIPAPSGHEEKRAEWVKAWLEKYGAKGVYIDGAKNVIWPAFEGKSSKYIMVSAHTDTVFSLDVPLEVKEVDGRIYCPGIGDDTANLTILMMGMRYLLEHPPVDNEYGILFVATAAEEIGSLGILHFLKEFGADKLYQTYSFDANTIEMFADTVNISNFKITVKGPGGHALGKYGTPNAIEELSRVLVMAADNCRKYIADNGLRFTTINAGTITGGERTNIIAVNAELMVELRSDRKHTFEVVKNYLMEAVEHYRSEQIEITVEAPRQDMYWNNVPDEVQEALAQEALELCAQVGWKPSVIKACFDCRAPMNLGIPSLGIGLVDYVGPHKLDENMNPLALPAGLELVLLILQRLLERK